MNQEKAKPIKRNWWCIATSIVTALIALWTLTVLYYVWFVAELHKIVGGWDKIKVTPMNLIDITILMTCAVGIWFQRSFFLVALLIYQVFDTVSRFYLIAEDRANPLGLIFPLAQFLLCLKAFFSLREMKRSSIGNVEAVDN
jgi:hypothetical protein